MRAFLRDLAPTRVDRWLLGICIGCAVLGALLLAVGVIGAAISR